MKGKEHRHRFNEGDIIAQHPHYPQLVLVKHTKDVLDITTDPPRTIFVISDYTLLDMMTGGIMDQEAYTVDQLFRPIEYWDDKVVLPPSQEEEGDMLRAGLRVSHPPIKNYVPLTRRRGRHQLKK